LLDRKRGIHSLAASFYKFGFSAFFSWGFVKDIVYHEKVQNVNELSERIVRAAVV
jgi:hypothetical protein